MFYSLIHKEVTKHRNLHPFNKAISNNSRSSSSSRLSSSNNNNSSRQHPPPPPQQQIQQQSQQHVQQQQQAPNPPLPQRLKPILKQSTANVQQPPTTVAQIATSQPCIPPAIPTPTSTNNNSDGNDDSIKTDDTDIDMQDAQPRWRRKVSGCKYF